MHLHPLGWNFAPPCYIITSFQTFAAYSKHIFPAFLPWKERNRRYQYFRQYALGCQSRESQYSHPASANEARFAPEFFHVSQRKPCESRPFRFCCVADYSHRKGYDVLFEAYRSLQHLGLHVELHVAGLFTDGADCRKAIVDRQLTGVYTYGRVDKHQVRKLLYQSDALVLASRSEVQPLVLLEAMSTGIPVVATECIPQCLRIEPGCTIVPVDDVLALSEAMRTVSQCDGFDGKTVSEKVRQMASPEVIGQKLAALFSDILASR